MTRRAPVVAAVVDLATGVRSGVVGLVRSVGKSGKGYTRGRVGSATTKLALQTPADFVLMVGGRAVSFVQQLAFVEPAGRRLTEDEQGILRRVYEDSIDLSRVVIKEGRAGAFSLNRRPFTHGDTIYMKGVSPQKRVDILVHEMCHVWQHQHGGTDYMTRALWAQTIGDGYDWEKGVRDGKDWAALNPEQQAELIQTAFSCGYFDAPDKGFSYGSDYTKYLEAALPQLRRGEGAA